LYLRLLGHLEWPLAGPALLRVATSAEEDGLRSAAMRSAAGFTEPEVVKTLLAPGKWSASTPALRETVLGAVLANPAHGPAVLAAIEAGHLPASALSAARRAPFLRSKDGWQKTVT
jgi:hypothetical protein